jgi:NAD(P)-dependent dehydrogenase (short-subunit alcohol dehydrogenase family)
LVEPSQRAFGAPGGRVVVSGRSHERGAEVVSEIRAKGGRADFVAAHLDGSAKASRDLAAEAARVLGGRIDVLVIGVAVIAAR